MLPLVSVIIPARNAEATISDSIESALRQTYSAAEILVVDDCSSDQTSRIVGNITDSRVRLIQGEGKGAATARNLGMRLAQGEFFQFLDADDLLSRDKLRLQIEALGNSSQIASCAWMHLLVDNQLSPPPDTGCWRIKSPIEWLQRSLSGEGMLQTACWLVPRNVAEKAGPWDEKLSLHDDGEYFCRVLLASEGNRFIEGCHVAYRVVDSSLSRIRSRAAVESAFRVCQSREQQLLIVDNSIPVKRSIATQWLQFAYEFHVLAPDLSTRAIQRASAINARPYNIIGGRGFQVLHHFLGWKTAFYLHRFLRK
jgi:glycosyltransferase involved in cell wall biosynthesis